MAITFRHSVLIAGLGLIIFTLAAGCGSMATRKGFYGPITAELQAGQYDSVVAGLEAAKESGKFGHKDRLVYYLDAGLAYHYAGQYDSSNARFHLADESAEELFTRSISRAAASVLLNDNVLEYAGEDYEVLYGNLFSALNYLQLGNFDEAFVEIRRANLKLELLEQKYGDALALLNRRSQTDTTEVEIEYDIKPVRFHNSAFARYLSMHLYAADGKPDDARIDYDYLAEAFRAQPYIYDFEMPAVRYATDEGAILSVVAMVGLAPVKEALNLRIRTDKDLNLVQVLYTDDARKDQEYAHLPLRVSADYYFKLSLPQLVDRPSLVSHVEVYADGDFLGRLELVEDVGSVARETFASRSSIIYLRSVARAVAKGLATHKAKKKADNGNAGGWLVKLAIDAATDLSENADLRCVRLLPGRILVGDFVLPEGSYDIRVDFIDLEGTVIESQTMTDYRVQMTGLNMMEAISFY